MAELKLQSTFSLPHSSEKLPILGFGVWTSHGDTCIKSCVTALQNGYRHIDTAQCYGNESQVGEALKQSGLKRSDVFVTSKILEPGTEEQNYEKLVESVKKINQGVADGKQGYIDLMLIHDAEISADKRKGLWVAMEKAQKEGLLKTIGVSNANEEHLEEMRSYAKEWPPVVNQIELHPWCQQREVVEYCHKQGIIVEAYCPLVRNKKANDKTLNSLSDKYGKTTGQILIRYCIEKGWSPLPKSDTPSRIKANAEVFGWSISKEDMSTLDALDEGTNGSISQFVENEE